MINRDSIQTYQSEKTQQDLNKNLITSSEVISADSSVATTVTVPNK